MLGEGSLYYQMLGDLGDVGHVPEQRQDGLHRLHLLRVDRLLSDLTNEEQKLLPDPVIRLHPLLLDQLVQQLKLGVAELAGRGRDDAVYIVLDILTL